MTQGMQLETLVWDLEALATLLAIFQTLWWPESKMLGMWMCRDSQRGQTQRSRASHQLWGFRGSCGNSLQSFLASGSQFWGIHISFDLVVQEGPLSSGFPSQCFCKITFLMTSLLASNTSRDIMVFPISIVTTMDWKHSDWLFIMILGLVRIFCLCMTDWEHSCSCVQLGVLLNLEHLRQPHMSAEALWYFALWLLSPHGLLLLTREGSKNCY